jgi:DNA-binding transcriptional ArsR family regulator
MSSKDADLSHDLIFDILSSARRRYVIYVLRREDEPMAVAELAEIVAAWENDTTVDQLDSQERKRVYVSLYQTHIPKLAEAGIVDHDRDTGNVYLTDTAFEVDRYLSDPDEEPFPVQYVYATLVVLSLVALALAWFDVALFGAVGDATVTTVLLGGFVLLAVSQYLYNRVRERPIPPELRR